MQGTAVQGFQGAAAVVVAARRPAQDGNSAAFRVSAQAAPGTARAAAPAAAPEVLLGLLAVQEAEGDAARDRAARKRGKEMLDELARLQRALLAGRLDPARLHALATLSADPADAADPALSAVLRAVAVRARVELARLGRGGTALRQGSDSGKRSMSAA